MSEGLPVSIGPASRTVIGAESTPSVATVLKPQTTKPQWKRFLLPAGIAGAIFLALRYKGHV